MPRFVSENKLRTSGKLGTITVDKVLLDFSRGSAFIMGQPYVCYRVLIFSILKPASEGGI